MKEEGRRVAWVVYQEQENSLEVEVEEEEHEAQREMCEEEQEKRYPQLRSSRG